MAWAVSLAGKVGICCRETALLSFDEWKPGRRSGLQDWESAVSIDVTDGAAVVCVVVEIAAFVIVAVVVVVGKGLGAEDGGWEMYELYDVMEV